MSAGCRQTLLRAAAVALLGLWLAGPVGAQPGGGAEDGVRARARQALEQAPLSFRTWLDGLPPDQRRPLLRRVAAMPEGRREHFFRRWEDLPEPQRARLESFLERRAEAAPLAAGAAAPFRRRLEQMSPEARAKLAPLVRRWRRMEPAQRRRMRQRLERFRTLPASEQAALIDQRFPDRSPEERARILESLREASRALPGEPPAAVRTPPERAPGAALPTPSLPTAPVPTHPE